jgi:uncharacterized protein YndB with AHSA1/START domain
MENPVSTGSVSRTVAAPPELIYDTITDVARMGEWSPECVGGEAAGPIGTGATFVGHNERGDSVWTSTCSVIDARRPDRFAFVAGDDPDVATVWAYDIEDLGNGTTRVTESFDSARLRHPEWSGKLAGRAEQLLTDMATTLQGLASAVTR